MSDWCDTRTYPGSLDEPPEYCENEPIEGTDKCPKHTDDRDPDAARDWAIEQRLEDTK